MSEKRRALGRGLGALIPTAEQVAERSGRRPADIFFEDAAKSSTSKPSTPVVVGRKPLDAPHSDVSRETTAADAPEAHTEGVSRETRRAQGGTGAESPDLRTIPGVTFGEIPVGDIRPNPRQPREVFDEDAMAELVHSISEIGVLQPIVVRPAPPDAEVPYELIMGERRWRATREAGLATIPAIVKDTADDELLRDALLENLHRSQLNPLEEAAAYQQMLDDFSCTHEDLAARIGRSRPQISNTVRLLKLPPLVQRRVAAGVLSAGHARALLSLSDGAAMERMAQRIVAEGLSVRSVEELVALGEGADEKKHRRRSAPVSRPELDDRAAALADRLDTRVKIQMGRKQGKLSVDFASVEDLDRILAVLGLSDL